MWITAEETGTCDLCSSDVQIGEEILECGICNWWKCQGCQGSLLPPIGHLQMGGTESSPTAGLRAHGHSREPTECSMAATERGAQVLAEHPARPPREGTASPQTDDGQREGTETSQFSCGVAPLATIQETRSSQSRSSHETPEFEARAFQATLEPPQEELYADMSDEDEEALVNEEAAPFVAPFPPSRVPWLHWSRLSRQPAAARPGPERAGGPSPGASTSLEALHNGSPALCWDQGASIFQECLVKVDRRFNFIEVHTEGGVLVIVRLHLITEVVSGPDASELLAKLDVEDERYPLDTAVVVRHGRLGAPLDHKHALIFIGAGELDALLLACVVAAPARERAEERAALALQRWWRGRRAEDAHSTTCDLVSEGWGSLVPPSSVMAQEEPQSVEALAESFRLRSSPRRKSFQHMAPKSVHASSTEAVSKKAVDPLALGDAPGAETSDLAAGVAAGVGPFVMHRGLRSMFLPQAVAQDPDFESLAVKQSGRPSLLDSTDALLRKVRSGLQIFGGCTACMVHDRAPVEEVSADKPRPDQKVHSATPPVLSEPQLHTHGSQQASLPSTRPPTPGSVTDQASRRWRMHGDSESEATDAGSLLLPPPPTSWDADASDLCSRAHPESAGLSREQRIEQAEAEQEARRKVREEAVERERLVAREALERARREAELDGGQAAREALQEARRKLELEALIDAQIRAQRAAREDALREAAAQEEARVREVAREQAARDTAARELAAKEMAAAREEEAAQAAREAARLEAVAREEEMAAREQEEAAARARAAKSEVWRPVETPQRPRQTEAPARARAAPPSSVSRPLVTVPVPSEAPAAKAGKQLPPQPRSASAAERAPPWAEPPLGQVVYQESWEDWRAKQSQPLQPPRENCTVASCAGRAGAQQCSQQ